MKDDKTLYKEFLEGDINSFETLVINHKDNLIYFISRYTGGDIYIAEDIAQDVFAYIYVHKEKYNDNFLFKTYIFTLGKNKAIDYIRKVSRTQLMDLDNDSNELSSQMESLEDVIIKDEDKRHILTSIKKLRPDYERVIYLFAFEEMSYKEIAKVFGKTLPQVKVLIHRARKSLKSIMEEGVGRHEK